ncbi:hypothetical protein N9A86_03475, partial [Akkermansiaceae bacterium]|nr:hypothetical protein [Akkermansiaceae bacterium]
MNKPPKATASYGSLVAAKIELHYGEVPVAIGTAFYYEKGNEKYLVTNWHNVTGREPSTGKVKHSKAAIPDTLRIVI